MKGIFTILAAIIITTSVFAQSPEKISYQAIIRDASNNLVTSQAVGMQISILQGATSGTAVYVETQAPTTNTNGLINIQIGTGTTNDDFAAINWANGPYFIKTETDPTGGTNYTITGVSQLASVPYALHAKTTESVTGTITETDPVYDSSVASGITATDTNYWNNKLDSYTETDPAYGESVASGITATDTNYWNNKLDSYTETDPVYGESVASGITATDTNYWNNKLDSYTETDPVYGESVASGITATDTNYWNNKLDSYTEVDPVFSKTVAYGITSLDTAVWNAKSNFSGDYNDLSNLPTIITNDSVLKIGEDLNPLIYGEFDNSLVTIDDVLRLTPRSSPPSNPLEGMIYSDQATNQLSFYMNGNWKSTHATNYGFVIRDSSKNVGIGTGLPKSKLEVVGDVYVSNITSGVILTSPNGSCFRITVDDTGALETTSINCPSPYVGDFINMNLGLIGNSFLGEGGDLNSWHESYQLHTPVQTGDELTWTWNDVEFTVADGNFKVREGNNWTGHQINFDNTTISGTAATEVSEGTDNDNLEMATPGIYNIQIVINTLTDEQTLIINYQ